MPTRRVPKARRIESGLEQFPDMIARLQKLLGVTLALAGMMPLHAAEYIDIPAGSFQSVLPDGDDKLLDVDVAAMRMRSEPVTNDEFLSFVKKNPEWRRDKVASIFAESRYLDQWPAATALGADQSRQAVVKVSWFAAQAFCESENARLPSWHEWEYVAAADATRRDARADPAWRNRILSWYSQTSGGAAGKVGGEANAYGVRDVHGLVWEWVDDFNALMVSADNREQGDPERLKFCGAGALSMQDRDNFAILMRIAMLSSLKGADVTGNVGFRCVRPASGDTR